ncbi:MAG: L-threonylcarbamoyladenylate synthase [Pseudomonadota bacterium]
MPTQDEISQAAAHVRGGRLVAFPTETVYGLGGDATNDRAVAAIFAAKGRPSFNPLIVHATSLAALASEVEVSALARELAAHFWPGPLTLVLPRASGSRLSLLCSAGLDSLAIRVPAHPLAQALLEACGCPLAAPSANRSGHVSPTQADHVRADLGDRIAQILDGGACPIGLESSVVDVTVSPPRLLRAGGLERGAIEALIGPLADATETTERPLSPGQLTSHYAPRLPLRLNAQSVEADEGLLAFGTPLAGAAQVENLSETGDVVEAAANLFAALRRLDQPGLAGLAAMPVPAQGLGEAINDRLRRAAAPR